VIDFLGELLNNKITPVLALDGAMARLAAYCSNSFLHFSVCFAPLHVFALSGDSAAGLACLNEAGAEVKFGDAVAAAGLQLQEINESEQQAFCQDVTTVTGIASVAIAAVGTLLGSVRSLFALPTLTNPTGRLRCCPLSRSDPSHDGAF
jgi:hypothetical protein